MSAGPSLDEEVVRQRIAFGYLADRARVAHQEGDGMLVNHLCATALSELAVLSKSGKLKLSVGETAWALILPLFWLVDDFMLESARAVLDRAKSTTDDEEELCAFLKSYHGMLQNPLLSFDQFKGDVANAQLRWAPAERSVEHEVIVTHLVELAWFHGPSHALWQEIAEAWRSRAPAWLASALLETERRLTTQTPLAVLGAAGHVRSAGVATDRSWLEELWECTLDCNWPRIDEILAERVPQTTLEMPRSRFLFDFRHFNRLHGVWGDDQATGLTRRRLTVTSFPKLIFDDLRASHCEKMIGNIYRGGKHSGDSHRAHAFRLAMLSELEALRLWDYFEWTESINAQSRLALEAAAKDAKNIGFASHGITLAVQSLSYESREPAIRDAIWALDFAPLDQRKGLLSQLLASRDVYAYSVLEVLGDLGDAMPDEMLESVADWSLKFLQLAKDKNLMGSTAHPLKFWHPLLRYLPETSPVWDRLAPAIVASAKDPMTWQTDDGLLGSFIKNAPEGLAVSAADAMLGTTSPNRGDIHCRWDILSDALVHRESLRPGFASRILVDAPGVSDRFHFCLQAKTETEFGDEEPAARAHIRSKVETYAAGAISSGGATTQRPSYRGITPLILQWSLADQDIVSRLIDTINHSRINNWCCPRLISFLQMFVQKGPPQFATVARQPLEIWMKERLPGMDPANNGPRAPWESSTDVLKGQIEQEIILLAREVWLQLAEEVPDFLDDWVRRSATTISPEAIPALVSLLLRMANENAGGSRNEWLSSVHALVLVAWGRYRHAPEYWETMNDIVNEIRWLFDSGYRRNSVSVSVDSDFVRATTTGLEPIWIEFGRSHSPNLRAATARLLRTLETRICLTAPLQQALTQLGADARARVRAQAVIKPKG